LRELQHHCRREASGYPALAPPGMTVLVVSRVIMLEDAGQVLLGIERDLAGCLVEVEERAGAERFAAPYLVALGDDLLLGALGGPLFLFGFALTLLLFLLLAAVVLLLTALAVLLFSLGVGVILGPAERRPGHGRRAGG
jgi:hypothetical protein